MSFSKDEYFFPEGWFNSPVLVFQNKFNMCSKTDDRLRISNTAWLLFVLTTKLIIQLVRMIYLFKLNQLRKQLPRKPTYTLICFIRAVIFILLSHYLSQIPFSILVLSISQKMHDLLTNKPQKPDRCSIEKLNWRLLSPVIDT